MSRILLVEDDPVTATILGRALDQSGHDVEIAKNGLAAVEMLEGGGYGALITDIMMPRLGGDELCRMVRADERYRDLPIFVTTGVIDPEKLSWIDSYHAVEVHTKPIRFASLIERIDQLTAD